MKDVTAKERKEATDAFVKNSDLCKHGNKYGCLLCISEAIEKSASEMCRTAKTPKIKK
jgi:hypothetical protein